MTRDLLLCIDVGTGSARAALTDAHGRIIGIASREQEQSVPQFGWAEQDALTWWHGVVSAIRELVSGEPLIRDRIAAISACGQMHGMVLVDGDGRLTRPTVPLWNDKRTTALVESFEAAHSPHEYLALTGNPATPAWPAFKLAWLRDNDPEAYERAATVLMPKDFINFRLTGEMAMDRGDGSLSFLMDPATREWSPVMAELFSLGLDKLPRLRSSLDILGYVTPEAARSTGLRPGIPVVVGGADYPVALLGSGVARPGLASDVTGTSCIVTVIVPEPILDAEICNVATVEEGWAAFVLLETGGDAVRWARRSLHQGDADYAAIMAAAAQAPAGADGLFFLPFLVGQRLGRERNARAQFFGLTAAHGTAHLDRALVEGVTFSAARALHTMERASGARIERVIAASGGAKSPLWLSIKASAYGVPILVPAEPECGIVGSAVIAATALNIYGSLDEAVAACVAFEREVPPVPAWRERYAAMEPIFEQLYEQSRPLYAELDALAERAWAEST
jgi:xylulokinase